MLSATRFYMVFHAQMKVKARNQMLWLIKESEDCIWSFGFSGKLRVAVLNTGAPCDAFPLMYMPYSYTECKEKEPENAHVDGKSRAPYNA